MDDFFVLMSKSGHHKAEFLTPVMKVYFEKLCIELSKENPILVDYNDSEFPISDELSGATEYESFLSEGSDEFDWLMPEDEWDAISLNYTSGTTGNP